MEYEVTYEGEYKITKHYNNLPDAEIDLTKVREQSTLFDTKIKGGCVCRLDDIYIENYNEAPDAEIDLTTCERGKPITTDEEWYKLAGKPENKQFKKLILKQIKYLQSQLDYLEEIVEELE